MIHSHVFHGIPRHFRKSGIAGILHNGYAAEVFDPPQTGASVVQRAAQDGADDSPMVSDGS